MTDINAICVIFKDNIDVIKWAEQRNIAKENVEIDECNRVNFTNITQDEFNEIDTTGVEDYYFELN